MLTPLEVQKKEFGRSFRGYNEKEVDQFLNEVMETLEHFVNDNLELKERLEHIEKDLNRYSLMEKTLSETLVVAKKTADEVIVQAQQKAELIQRSAEEDIKRRTQDAETEMIGLHNKLDETRRELVLYKNRFRNLVQSQLEMFDKEAGDV